MGDNDSESRHLNNFRSGAPYFGLAGALWPRSPGVSAVAALAGSVRIAYFWPADTQYRARGKIAVRPTRAVWWLFVHFARFRGWPERLSAFDDGILRGVAERVTSGCAAPAT
jgi:hypothetical protein